MADAVTIAPNVSNYSNPNGKQEDARYDDANNDQSPYKPLVKQIQTEYNQAYRAQNGRIQINLMRLKLYNNQMRQPDAVGDTTLFDIFQSVFAALYTDQLSTEFSGRTEGASDAAEAQNNVYKFDYDEMKLAQLDYEWDFDTLFFGWGLQSMYTFDRKKMIPIPDTWDPMVTLRDPDAVSVNGDPLSGKGAARYFGREIQLRKMDMEKIPSVFDIEYLKDIKSTKSMYQQAKQQREAAQGLNNEPRKGEKDLGINANYNLIEWYTWWSHPELTNGVPKRVLVWLGNDQQKVFRFKVIKRERWPVIHRKLFPTAHSWESTSIPDLVEDKQRMKAVLLNLGVKLMKSDLFGMYLYDLETVTNKSDLDFDFDKKVGIKPKAGQSVADSVVPMPKSQANFQMFNWIMQGLDLAAQRGTATPEIQMGQPTKGNKTLGEINKVDAKSTNRYSLAARIWQWSETERAEQWYECYQEHFKERIDEKEVKINTVFGPKFRVYTKSEFVSDANPDIKITSKFVSDQQKTNDRALTLQFGQILAQTPGANMRYFVKRMGKLHDIPKDELDRLLPPTPDEMKARYENMDLEKDKVVPVDQNDNHQQHLEEHMKCKETPALLSHVATHMHAMELQQKQPQLFPQMQQQQGQQPGQPGMMGQPGGQQPGAQQIGEQLGKTQKKKFNQPQMSLGGFQRSQQ